MQVRNNYLAFALLSLFWHSPGLFSQEKNQDYFNCSYYNYFPYDTSLFDISHESDSLRVAFAYRAGYANMHHEKTISRFPKLWPGKLTSQINGLVDTVLLKKVLLNNYQTSRDTSSFLVLLAQSNILFYGQVIDKRFETNPEICFDYRTSYVIRIDSILYSNISAERGNLILAKESSGPVLRCPDNQGDTLQYRYVGSHRAPKYTIGRSGLFLLTNTRYLNHFRKRKKENGVLNPKNRERYCPNVFTFNDTYIKVNTEIISAALMKIKRL